MSLIDGFMSSVLSVIDTGTTFPSTIAPPSVPVSSCGPGGGSQAQVARLTMLGAGGVGESAGPIGGSFIDFNTYRAMSIGAVVRAGGAVPLGAQTRNGLASSQLREARDVWSEHAWTYQSPWSAA